MFKFADRLNSLDQPLDQKLKSMRKLIRLAFILLIVQAGILAYAMMDVAANCPKC